MAEMRLPVMLVQKLKKSADGINEEVDYIRNDLEIEIDFDGKEAMKLRHKSSAYLDIAMDVILSKHKLMSSTNEETKVSIENRHVKWSFMYELAWKIGILFEREISEKLKSFATLKVSPDKTSKLPSSVEILCMIKDFDRVYEVLNAIQEKCKDINPHSEQVQKKHFTAARKFSLQNNYEGAFCCFEHGDLKIFGIDEQTMELVLNEWKKSIGVPVTSKDSGAETPSKQTNDKTKPASSKSGNLATSRTSYKAGNGMSEDTISAKLASSKAEHQASSNLMSPRAEISEDLTSSAMEKKRAPNDDKGTLHPVDGKPEGDIVDETDDKIKHSDNPEGLDKPDKDFMKHSTVDTSRNAAASFPDRQLGKKSKDGKYEFYIGPITVLVYKNSVTEIKGMDAIVNAANEKMMHGGGVAYYISKAAGKKMDDECSEYIRRKGPLKVTENFVSKAGNMKCKGIIHAVGPQWYNYKGKEQECAKDVYETIMNCFVAAKERGWTKMALIAISSGIFGVPKQLCTDMYIKAIADFGLDSPGSLQEIHFIDVNQEILDLVEATHGKWVKNPDSISFDNALHYQSGSSFSGQKTMYSKDRQMGKSENRDESITVKFVRQSQNQHHYKIGEGLDVKVYTRSVLELERNVDAIVCSMDKEFNGMLLKDMIKKAGYEMEREYEKSVRKMRALAKDGDVFAFPGGRLTTKVICVVIGRYITETSEKELSQLNEYYTKITEKAEKERITCLALPMIGCGSAKDPQSCCKQLIKTILCLCQEAREMGQKPSLREIHLVNNDSKFTKHLLEALKDFEDKPFYAPKTQTLDRREAGGWILHLPLEEEPQRSTGMKVSVKTMNPANKKEQSTLVKTQSNCHYYSECKKTATNQLPCGHLFCKMCNLSMTSGCKVCEKDGKSLSKSVNNKASDGTGQCPICLEDFPNLEKLPCNHKLCKTCFEKVKARNPTCPTCMAVFGIVTGNQPDGKMYYKSNEKSLPGYQSNGTIEVVFVFQDGIQKETHPNPGFRYKGTERRAYLPDNAEGRKVLQLFCRAFDRRLLFTIGESRTSGKENCVTFNDVHFKTKVYGGTENFGYPDDSYLTRVQEELKAKGITD